MAYKSRIVLQLPLSDASNLPPFVEECLRDGVQLIAIVGEGCRQMEDVIDDLIVRDGSDANRFIATTSHPDESLEDVVEFAEIFGEAEGVQLVRL